MSLTSARVGTARVHMLSSIWVTTIKGTPAARQAAESCHWLITVGDQPRTEAIRRGAREGGLHRDSIRTADTVQQAMDMARALPGEGKMVLLLNDLTDNY